MAEDTPYQTIQSEDGTTWVEIATAPNSDEAQLIQGFLEAEGIDAQIEHAGAARSGHQLADIQRGELQHVRIGEI